MTLHPIKALLAIAAFWLISAASAHATTVVCPTDLTSHQVTSAAGTASSATATTLTCSFAVHYSAVAPELPNTQCSPVTQSLNFSVVGGGTAVWAIQGNPVVLHGHLFQAPPLPHGIKGLRYCYYGVPFNLTLETAFTLKATSPVPAGANCVVSGPHTFNCVSPPPPPCSGTISSSKIPTGASFPPPPFTPPLPSGSGPWFYQFKSGIDQVTSGPNVLFEPGNVSLSTIVSAINSQPPGTFATDVWTLVAPLPELPAGYSGCWYKGLPFQYPFSGVTYTLVPIVAIVCKEATCDL